MPDGLTALTRLAQLDLSGNRLATPPDGLAALTDLIELDLNGNQLTALRTGQPP